LIYTTSTLLHGVVPIM